MTSTEYSQKTNTQYGVVRNRSVSGNQIENSFLYKGDSNIDETSDIFQVLIKENKSSLVDSIPLLQDRPGAVHSDNNLKIQFKNQKEKLTIFMGSMSYIYIYIYRKQVLANWGNSGGMLRMEVHDPRERRLGPDVGRPFGALFPIS